MGGGADTINGSAPNIQPMDQDDQGAGDRPGGRQGQKPGAGNSEDADDTLGYGGSEKMTSEADVLALCRNLMMRMGPGGHKRAKQAFAMRWMKNNMGVTDMDWLTMENLIRQGISIAHDEEGIIEAITKDEWIATWVGFPELIAAGVKRAMALWRQGRFVNAAILIPGRGTSMSQKQRLIAGCIARQIALRGNDQFRAGANVAGTFDAANPLDGVVRADTAEARREMSREAGLAVVNVDSPAIVQVQVTGADDSETASEPDSDEVGELAREGPTSAPTTAYAIFRQMRCPDPEKARKG